MFRILAIAILVIAAIVIGSFLRDRDFNPSDLPTGDDITDVIVDEVEEGIKDRIGEIIDERLPDLPNAPVFPETPDAVKGIIEGIKDVDISVGGTSTFESEYGFSVSFDASYTKENTRIALPGGKIIQAVGIVRYVDEGWCGGSSVPENCRPFLENPGIAFGVIGKSPAQVTATYLRNFISLIEAVEIAGRQAAQFFAGVDGEGVVTILMPLSDQNKTLVIQYTFDEIFDHGSHGRDILDSGEQKKVVDQILGTLNIK